MKRPDVRTYPLFICVARGRRRATVVVPERTSSSRTRIYSFRVQVEMATRVRCPFAVVSLSTFCCRVNFMTQRKRKGKKRKEFSWRADRRVRVPKDIPTPGREPSEAVSVPFVATAHALFTVSGGFWRLVSSTYSRPRRVVTSNAVHAVSCSGASS